MAKFECAAFGNSEKRESLNFWFCAHPDDKNQYLLPTIKNFCTALREKGNLQHWAIWYDSEPVADYDRESFIEGLFPMKLFILIVTRKLLTTPNRALDVEFAYAMENKTPVLPLMMEEGLDVLFAEKCGSLQYLVPEDRSYTANLFKDKLEDYLSSFFVDDKLRDRIYREFDSTIFLSYRKIDRKSAQELMELIHRNEDFRDVAIWYDEFLTPGKDYNELIAGEIANSSAFFMTVTWNITRASVNAQGLPCDNYIVTDEYPAAVAAGVPIIPVLCDFNSLILRDNLKWKFPDIPDCIPIEDVDGIHAALSSALSGVELGKKRGNPKHEYLIGMAYLHGIRVEVDKTRAVALIKSAAEAGCVEAMNELAMIYNIGNGIAKDPDQYVKWKCKIIDLAKEKLADSDSLSDAMLNYYISIYLSNVSQLTFGYLFEDKHDLCAALLSDVRQIYDRFQYTRFSSMIADRLHGLYTVNATLTLNNDELREEYLLRAYATASTLMSLAESRSTVFNLSDNALHLAEFYNKKDKNDKAEEYFIRAEETAEKAMNMDGRIIATIIGKKHHSPDESSRNHFCTCLCSHARFLIKLKRVGEAEEYYAKAEALVDYVAKKDTIRAQSALTLAAYIMNYKLSENDIEGAREHYLKILRVLDVLDFKKSDISEIYELLGIYCEYAHDYSGAERLYIKAFERSDRQILDMTSNNYAACIKLLVLLSSVSKRSGSVAMAEQYASRANAYRKIYYSRCHEEHVSALIASSVSDYFYVPEALVEYLKEKEKDYEIERTDTAPVPAAPLFKSAENYIKLAERHLSVGNLAPARQNFLKAIEILEGLCAEYPDEADYAAALARAEERLSAASDSSAPAPDEGKKTKKGIISRIFKK